MKFPERFTEWKKRKAESLESRKESGDTFILYLLLFPVMFAFFGLAVDVAAASYTQNTLQSALDTATQSTVSQSSNTLFGPTLDITKTQKQVYRLYDKNRNSPFTACQGTDDLPYAASAAVYKIKPPSGCGFSVNYIRLNTSAIVKGRTVTNVVDVGVTEYSNYLFLGFIGMDHQQYQINSRAYLTAGQSV